MFQVRFHGRGGQGVVTAAALLASAAFSEGLHAQAFPGFGPERMGAPVISFCRIDDKPIRTHEPVSEPDALIIHDPTLLHQADLFGGFLGVAPPGQRNAGLSKQGYMLINSTHGFDELGLEEFVSGFHRDRLLVVPGLVAGPHPPRPPAARRRAARRLRGADLGGQPGLGAGRHQREVLGPGRGRKHQCGPGRIRLRQGRARGTGRCLSNSRVPRGGRSGGDVPGRLPSTRRRRVSGCWW